MDVDVHVDVEDEVEGRPGENDGTRMINDKVERCQSWQYIQAL